ncbi:MAG: ATP-dependent DNA helicase [Leptolyngbya sp. SIO4C1]|nr:ATP-dependent DNA helicase [Leptolyngbya sp. SIO4C1]
MIEAEVHQRLRAFLREQGHTQWPHHLTMARLVARALRIGRSALIQTGSASAYCGYHRLSYLMPALIWPEPAILVIPEFFHQRLMQVDIPHLLQSVPTVKSIQVGERWPAADFRGLLMTSPEAWLSSQLQQQQRFPGQVLTLIDGADQLESWAREQLTSSLRTADWEALALAYPGQQTAIRDLRVRLTHAIFQHPVNPYDCYLIDQPEQALLLELYASLAETPWQTEAMPPAWQAFWQLFQAANRLAWIRVDREQGRFSLHCAPAEVATRLAPIWQQQPLVLVGAAVDASSRAEVYRERLGLGDLTCVRFAPDRRSDIIQLYLPDRLPLPNTSHFQTAILQEIRALLSLEQSRTQPTVIVVGDEPLKAQIGTALAAEFGSRVQVEKAGLMANGILVTGWQFWQDHQLTLPPPGLLVITTLPLPSLENPLVAGQVAYYKRLRQDWFRLYLLPEALRTLQLAIASVRVHRGLVALLDNRVNHRSYGQQILATLSPAARTNYLDPEWLSTALDQTL